MSFSMHGTDEVFAALRGMCSNSCKMYDPCDDRYYYDHDCETYVCAVEEAADEYARLLKHCEKQREELAAIKNPLGNLKESFGGDMDNIDGGTEVETIRNAEKDNLGITGELREYIGNFYLFRYEDVREKMDAIADRIDERHAVKVERLEKYRAAVDAMLKEYVKLPVDADGVPIRAGDEMDVGIVFAIGDEGVFMVENGFSGKYDVECFDGFACHHVQPDTWERIIEDAISESGWEQPKEYEIDFEDSKETRDRFVAELVERCRRLAGE